jgi:GNAT superfamily N-acetyltransferase
VVEMARLACTIEDRPLPPADSAEVVSMLPSADDYAVVAQDGEGRLLGAAWWCLRDPPLVADAEGTAIPEMAMAVVKDARGRGVGSILIEALAQKAADRFDALSLNVHIRNPAARLYTRTGFRVAGAGRGRFGVAMVRRL